MLVLDTGPAANDRQAAALQSASYVLVVSDGQWGGRTDVAGRTIMDAVRALAEKDPDLTALLVRNKGSKASDDESVGVPACDPRVIEDLVLQGQTGPLCESADEILDALGVFDDGDRDGPAVLAVVGGKGGVGKSTIAALVANRVRELGGKAVIVDLDTQVAGLSTIAKGAKAAEEEILRLDWAGPRARERARPAEARHVHDERPHERDERPVRPSVRERVDYDRS